MKRYLIVLFFSTTLIRGEAAASLINTQTGFAVSIDGGWLAVGSPRDDEKGTDAGAVLLFQRVPPCWVLRQKLTAGGYATDRALFGSSVSLRDGLLAVAAAGKNEVYISHLLPVAMWSLPIPQSVTGQSVSIAGTDDGWRLAVGDVDPHGHVAGTVHVLEDPPGNKVPDPTPIIPLEKERFGHAVSLRGDLLVVGAPGSAQTAGTAYVFRRQNGGWQQEAALTAADGRPGDQLGYSVAVDDAPLVIAGAPTAGDKNEGAAYVFSGESGTWEELRKRPALGAGSHSGLSVAIDEGHIAIGAPFPFSASPPGAVLTFERGPGEENWSGLPHVVAAQGSAYDLAGFSVALEQAILDDLLFTDIIVAVGAPLANQKGNDFYTLTPCRVLDTREPPPMPPAPLFANQKRIVQMTGSCGIPSDASAVVVNITATAASAAGELTAFPSTQLPPMASAISYPVDGARGNNAVLKLGLDGGLAFFANQPSGSVHLIVDVNGYFKRANANGNPGAFYSELCQEDQ